MPYNYNYTSLRGRAQEIIWLYGTNGRWKIPPCGTNSFANDAGDCDVESHPFLREG